jgi:hypothetical protein
VVNQKKRFDDLFFEGKWRSTELRILFDAGLISKSTRGFVDVVDDAGGAGELKPSYWTGSNVDMLKMLYQLISKEMCIKQVWEGGRVRETEV